MVGELGDIGAAAVRRSYRRDSREGDTGQRVFGRAPDAVLRKQAQGGAPSTWVRVWLAPIRFQGQSRSRRAGRPACRRTLRARRHGKDRPARGCRRGQEPPDPGQ
ncbi:hypothetical protein ACU4GD_36715 [Cupriavidus basilensis]